MWPSPASLSRCGSIGNLSRGGPVKMSLLYETFPREDITAEMMGDAARLFTENYGVWGILSLTLILGKRVTLTGKRLQEQYLPMGGECWYLRATSKGILAGNAFTCRWSYGGRNICWVTQLVVHRDFRGKGIASSLLRMAMADSDDIYGIMSSHPFACVAAAAVFGSE
ncbi:hypothetical protein FDECE_14298 [Fusarium decemcellulare]|nr:hypothetical protein FDECE_14298 [Fusarium decemcellulare]